MTADLTIVITQGSLAAARSQCYWANERHGFKRNGEGIQKTASRLEWDGGMEAEEGRDTVLY